MKDRMGLRTRRGLVLALCAAIGAMVFSGCEQRTVRQIMAEPGRYADREVGVVGDVVQSYSVLGRGAYQVDDGTGRIWVVASHGVPRKGSRVGVKGKVRDGVDLGGIVKLPEQVGNGLVLLEAEHRAK
jgi:hypothetical protein